MIPNRNVAGAVGGKTARPCENCLRRRARWFCPADDAFLCQACDTSVHTANPLARRHQRVRLKTASFVSHIRTPIPTTPPTSWHCGFTRKARTPRHAKPTPPHHRSPDDAKSREGTTTPTKTTTTRPLMKPAVTKGAPVPVVPELSADDAGTSPDENEEQLLYRVPIFDPFEATATVLNDVAKDAADGGHRVPMTTKGLVGGLSAAASCDEDNGNDDGAASGSTTEVHGFLPSEMDLAEFAADVENLLGSGLEQECFGMDELGILEDCKDNKYSTNYNSMESSPLLIGADGSVEYTVKDEEDDVYGAAPAREPFKLGFDQLHSADDPAGACGGVDEKSAVAGRVPVGGEQMMISVSVGDGGRLINDNNNNSSSNDNNNNMGSNKLLKLDYEAVITAWEGKGSPWTSGDRPEFNPDECWPDCMGTDQVIHCGPNYEEAAGGIGSRHGGAVGDVDGGREARVSRYREKRRTRLFSKKIRYEVRKLNAEKRPRMKGRFVKRASVSGHALAPLPHNYIRK